MKLVYSVLQSFENGGGFRSIGLHVERSAIDADRQGGTCHGEISRSYLGRWRNDKIEEGAILKGSGVLRSDQKFVSSIPSFKVPLMRSLFPITWIKRSIYRVYNGKCRR